jgi:hypothetical protein
VTEHGGEHRDHHRHGADQHRSVGDAGVSNAEVLQDDHAAEAERADRDYARMPGCAQMTARDERQQRSRQGKPTDGQPAGTEPAERDLRKRHGGAPEDSCGDQREDGGAAMRHRYRMTRESVTELHLCLFCELYALILRT